MQFYWTSALCITVVACIKSKSGGHEFTNDLIHGQCAPLGPLSNTFVAKLRLPGFPFEFPPILPGSRDRYLIFPGPDSLADYEASIRRCEMYNGKLVDLETPTEMEILACAIGTPSFIGSWFDIKEAIGCAVLYPGGVLSLSAENCLIRFGSICKIPGNLMPEGFQV